MFASCWSSVVVVAVRGTAVVASVGCVFDLFDRSTDLLPDCLLKIVLLMLLLFVAAVAWLLCVLVIIVLVLPTSNLHAMLL